MGYLLYVLFKILPEVSVLGSGEWKKSKVYTMAVLDHKQVTVILRAIYILKQNGALRDLELPIYQ